MTKASPKEINYEDYSYTKNLTLEGWAWEALRRNEDYREDYKKFQDKAKELQKKHGDMWDKEIVAYDPPKNECESDNAWKLRAADRGYIARKLNLSGKYAQHWHLQQMHPPDQVYSKKISFIHNNSWPRSIEFYDDLHELIPAYELDDGYYSNTIVHPYRAVIVFDLTQSVETQMSQAKKLIQTRANRFQIKQKGTLKQSQKKWRRHLMVLDILDSGIKISNERLVKECAPGKKFYDFAKAGFDFKRRAKEFPQKYSSILLGFYSE